MELGLPAKLGLLEPPPRLQSAADRPGLYGGAAWAVRRIAFENLADRAHRLVHQCIAYACQVSFRCRCIATDTTVGEAKGSKQPAPNRSLMITAVTLQYATAIARMVFGATGRERAQSERGEKLTPADLYDFPLILQRERAVRQAYGKYLVWPDAGIITVGTIDHVI